MNFNPELAPASPAQPLPPADETTRLAKLAVALASLTFVMFLPVVNCEWLNYDDDAFVTNNPNVAAGLTWEGVKWAFTSADIDYWRPLSWLSHMVDVELFGSVAGGHHLTNLLIHCAGVVMALLALHRLTRRLWPSVVVAALFACHPLHIESVAWIAERKDVLCGFFFWLTLWCYAAYVSNPGPRTYLRVFGAFMLGIMSKPMIVTLPCVLLLLDVWPLRRVKILEASSASGDGRGGIQQVWSLLREKLPLFVVVLVLGLSTIYSQHRVGTLAGLEGLPLWGRILTSLAAYASYLTQTFLPVNLCVLYPLEAVATWHWLAAALLLLLTTGLCLWRLRRQPYLLVGWLWFLGMLVPVIGLMQVGEQAHADRYTYLPLNGLFLMLAWTAADWAAGHVRRQRLLVAVSVAVLVLCGWGSRHQLQYWQNGITAFGRALEVTQNSPTAFNNYGNALRTRGRIRESLPYFEESTRLRMAQNPLMNLGFGHLELGEDRIGLFHLRRAFALDPHSAVSKDAYATTARDGQNSADPVFAKVLAIAEAARSRYDEAAKHLERAAQLAPRDAGIFIDQSAYLAMAGRDLEATRALRRALEITPGDPLAQANLAALLAKLGQLDEALKLYELTLAADPGNFRTRHNHALLLARSGRCVEARREFEQVLQMQPKFWPAMQQLAWLLATRQECRDAPAALRHASAALTTVGTKSAALLDVVAAAEAANGNFQLAATLAREALSLIRPGKDTALEAGIKARLEGYLSQRMHTEASSASSDR